MIAATAAIRVLDQKVTLSTDDSITPVEPPTELL